MYNLFASYYSVSPDEQTYVIFPSVVRELYIYNGSDAKICIDLLGRNRAVPISCVDDGEKVPKVIQLDSNVALTLSEFLSASSLSIIVEDGTSSNASPISVIATY